ncbi:hypothetical protein D1872_224630 [compost metagenome]
MPVLELLVPGVDTTGCKRTMPDIEFSVPLIIIIPQNRYISHIFRTCKLVADRSEFLAYLSSLQDATVRPVVVVIQTMPVDFCPYGRCTPAEIQNKISPMQYRLICP